VVGNQGYVADAAARSLNVIYTCAPWMKGKVSSRALE